MRGRQIFEKEGQVERIDPTTYRVSSQSGHGFYQVIHAEGGGVNWKCSCPDHTNRTAKCKHIWAVHFSLAIKAEVKAERQEITQIESLTFLHAVSVVRLRLSVMGSGTTRQETSSYFFVGIVADTSRSISVLRR